MSESNREDGTSSEDQHVDPTAPAPYPQEYGSPPPPPPATGTFGTPPPLPPPAAPYVPPGQGLPPAGDETASPYGASPYGGTPYGGTPAYGSPASPYGTPPPAYYQSAAPQSNTSALVLTIVSAIGTLSCCLPLPALILGILALSKQTREPEQSAKLARYGWITFAVMVGLAVVAFIAFMGFAITSSSTTTYDF